MKTTSIKIILFGLIVALSSSCAPVDNNSGREVAIAAEPLSCIAVLPVRTVADDGAAMSSQAEGLRAGARFADTVLEQALAGKDNIKILSNNDLSNLNRDSISGLVDSINLIGKEMNCEAAMVMTLRRYQQRDGGAYAVDAPASASFDMRLFDTAKKSVLWAADFDETQESFLSNIFSFSKMQQRGFKWITVEELVSQGINERLEESPYFSLQ